MIRFKIDDSRTISWNDMVRGPVSWQASDLGGDMVIARASSATTIGQPLYNLAVVVDDMDMAITHVIRGEDHIANTAKQILLYEAFGANVPAFAHTAADSEPEWPEAFQAGWGNLHFRLSENGVCGSCPGKLHDPAGLVRPGCPGNIHPGRGRQTVQL